LAIGFIVSSILYIPLHNYTPFYQPADALPPEVAAVIREARRCNETGEKKVLAINDSGHSWLDVRRYDGYLAKQLEGLKPPSHHFLDLLAKVS